MAIQIWDMLVRVLEAGTYGAAIGWEREARDKPAGLSKHILVAIGAVGVTFVT